MKNIMATFFWGSTGSSSKTFCLYSITLCTWYITYYALKVIREAWPENLVLRRVHCLEADHHGDHQSELGCSVYQEAPPYGASGNTANQEGGTASTGRGAYHPPWILDPESRDTVPNIKLYCLWQTTPV